jgi:hypothetical protein
MNRVMMIPDALCKILNGQWDLTKPQNYDIKMETSPTKTDRGGAWLRLRAELICEGVGPVGVLFDTDVELGDAVILSGIHRAFTVYVDGMKIASSQDQPTMPMMTDDDEEGDPAAWIGPNGQTMSNEVFLAWKQAYPEAADEYDPLYR